MTEQQKVYACLAGAVGCGLCCFATVFMVIPAIMFAVMAMRLLNAPVTDREKRPFFERQL